MLFRPRFGWPGLVWGQTTRQRPIPSAGNCADFNLADYVECSAEQLHQHWTTFTAATSIKEQQLARAQQVHSDTVLEVRKGGQLGKEADALYSTIPGIAVAVFTADCVPVLLVDPITRSVAAAHCGWRGAAADLVTKTISTLTKSTGGQPSNLYAWVGAHIAGSSYEVGAEVATRFRESCHKALPSGKFLLDLGQVVHQQLVLAGVPPDHIDQANCDTFSVPTTCYSYRRDAAPSGRMMSFVGFLS